MKKRKKPVAPMMTARAQDKADLFNRYLHRRMCVRYKMHGDKTILGKKVPEPPSDPILDLCISGNAYRHLDTDDHVVSEQLREHVSLQEGARPTDEQLERMLPVMLLRVAGFNEERMAGALGCTQVCIQRQTGRRRAKPRTLTCPDSVTCAFRTCRPVTRDTTAANASLFGSRVPALKHSRRWQEGCWASSATATSFSCT